MSERDPLDTGLRRMGEGIRRARTGFDAADDGFIEALEGLTAVTEARGSLDTRLQEMADTIAHLQDLILAQGDQLRQLRERLNGGQA